MPRRLVIFSPGLRSLAGHNYAYAAAIAAAARARFDAVEIYADRAFQPPPNAPVPVHSVLNILPLAATKRLLGNPLRLLKRKIPATPGTAFLPGNAMVLARLAYSVEIILGLLRVLWRQRARQEALDIFIEHAHVSELYALRLILPLLRLLCPQPVTFHLVLRYTPEFFGARFIPRHLQALMQAKTARIYFYTDSTELTAAYRAALPHAPANQFTILPIPVCLPEPPPPRPHAALRLSMLGPPRAEKGFGLLPQIVQHLHLQAELCVQVDAHSAKIMDALMRQQRGTPLRITPLHSPLAQADYYAAMASTDILLLPYISPKYAASTSGIFAEALYFGIPCITLAHTWMAARIREAAAQGLRIGEIIGDICEIGAAAEKIAAALPVYRADVARYCTEWNRFHTPQNLINILASHA